MLFCTLQHCFFAIPQASVNKNAINIVFPVVLNHERAVAVRAPKKSAQTRAAARAANP